MVDDTGMHTFIDNTKYTKSITIHHTCHCFEFIMEQSSITQRSFGEEVNNSCLPKKVPIVGLGCSSFSNSFVKNADDMDTCLSCNQNSAHLLPRTHQKVKEWIQTIKHAVDNGINLLDTAPWYGHGSSEVVIGLALKESNIDRSKILINTKVGRYDSDPSRQFDFSFDATIQSAKRSIERMGCGYIDVLQLHDPEFSPSIELLLEETIPAMLECKKKGWAKALGLTGFPLETHYQILQRVSEGTFDQTLLYGHFNLHNQNLFTVPMCSEKQESLVEYCQSNSIAVMAAAPLSMGLLTHNVPPFWHPADSTLKQACKDAADLAEENSVNLPTLAILFALAHDCVGCTLLGMGNIKDVDYALAIIKRYEKLTESHISSSGVTDGGKMLRQTIVSKLAPILTESESKVLKIILDDSNGPFANVWKSGNSVWDGIEEAATFWSSVKGGKAEAEKRMKVRSS